LRHLGQENITSLDEDTPSSRAVVEYYSIARDETLESHRWAFATVVETLVANTNVDNTDYPDWLYFYDFPSNALAIWNVFNGSTTGSLSSSFPGWDSTLQSFPNSDKENQDFEVRYNPTNSEQVICSNLASALVEYSYKVTDTTQWNKKFILAFTYKLAAMMAHSLIGDPNIGLRLMETYNALIAEAKRLDFSHKKKKPNRDSGYINARG